MRSGLVLLCSVALASLCTTEVRVPEGVEQVRTDEAMAAVDDDGGVWAGECELCGGDGGAKVGAVAELP